MAIGLILFLGFLFLIIVPFSILIIVIIVKGRNQSWKGTIVDKLENEKRDEDNHLHTYYTVVVELEGGKEAKIAVDKGKYDIWNVGDKLEKAKGESWPQKIETTN